VRLTCCTMCVSLTVFRFLRGPLWCQSNAGDIVKHDSLFSSKVLKNIDRCYKTIDTSTNV
jgi:hypothetical protein